jgi:prolyl-tRNA editing enzyme YbaK/EbsC (Cys-tRNA(Pro) deacylase)
MTTIMANPHGQIRAKPFRDALQLEIAEASDDPKRLRRIAKALLMEAETGNVAAINTLADRLDGKVPQAVVGDDEHDPIRIEATDEQRRAAVAALLGKKS